MNSRRDPNGSSHPALVPLHGNHEKKPRHFDRDVATIGRARGTDICLDAAEISTLHCVIYRTAQGLRIRDCGSRTGSRVNGANVKNQPLLDGDILQLGPFSFEVKIPADLAPKRVTVHDPVQLNRMQASRLHLAQIALRLRRRLRSACSGDSAMSDEMGRKAQMLRDKIKNYDQRLLDLEDAEKELEQERRVVAKEREEHAKHVQKVEKDSSERLKAVDEQIHERWQSFQMRCQVEESRHLQELESRSRKPSDDVDGDSHLMADLEAKTRIITDQAKVIAHRTEDLRNEQLEFQQLKQKWESERGQMTVKLDEQRAAAGQKDAQLKAQRSELTRMMTELKRMQEEFRQHQKVDVQEILLENQTLREQVQAFEQRPVEQRAAPDHGLLEQLRAENETLRQLLHAAPAPAKGDPLSAEELNRILHDMELVRAENDQLRQLLGEREPAAEDQEPPKQANDLESYETELNEFRRQLETDRSRMVQEIEQLRLRNQDLDEARREMEMELSRERAELARERMRLDRMRDEVKSDMDRMQRELSVRDSMAQVQKLRDEINQKKQPPGAVSSQLDKKLSERLRNIRVTDTPS